MPRVIAEVGVGLESPERWEDLRETPAWIAASRPRIEVRWMTAHGEPRQPGRSPEELPASELRQVAVGSRLGFVAPVGRPVGSLRIPPAVEERGAGAVAQIRPGFEEQHGPTTFGESTGQDASGGAAADDEDLDGVRRHSILQSARHFAERCPT